MLCDKEKEWLVKKIDEKFPRGEGEPAHPIFQRYKENDKVHDLVWGLIETQGYKRFYEWIIAGLIFTPAVKALAKLTVFGALAATFVGLALIYGVSRIINRLSKLKERNLTKKNRKKYVEQMGRAGKLTEKSDEKNIKNNRMIKKLKLIGYVLACIALFFGVIIAINYIEGNGMKIAINHNGDRIEPLQARGDVQLAEAPGSFTNAIQGESWVINDEKVGLMSQKKITPSISDFRDNCRAILDPGTEAFVLWGRNDSSWKYCRVKNTRQRLQGWILATSITSAQKL